MLTLACPKCGASEVRKLSLIYDEGRSTIRTQSQTVGAGFSGGGMGFGSASTSTTGQQQTALSKQAAPPARKMWLLWGAVAVVSGFMALGGLRHPGFGTLVLIAIVAWAARSAMRGREYNATVHPGLLERWQRSWMCNRCGDMFAAE
jgi:hypothetical protein